uniref:Uncharacterized protein n=1 Tax=Arundo donax TaxID=35708 RepID=A0A0A9BCX6_ARUDO
MGWNGSIFQSQAIYTSSFAITVQFTSRHNAEKSTLTTVYGPCQRQERDVFIQWMHDLEVPIDEN